MNKNIIIIGGSLAGSFCAYLLGKAGFQVTLIDRQGTSKNKACGEGLSSIGKKYLDKSGVWDESFENSANPFYEYDLTFRDRTKISLSGKQTIGYAIQRNIIDTKVFQTALSTGKINQINDKVTSIVRSNNSWIVKTENSTFNTENLILAGGYAGRSLIAPPKDRVAPKNLRFGMTLRAEGIWKNGIPQKIIILNNPGNQILITPFINHKVNISILATKDSNSETKEAMIQQAKNHARDSGFEIHSIEECQGASFISNSKPDYIPQELYLIGDCAEIFDPIGGMGMSHALLSASLAAKSIATSLEIPENKSAIWSRYNKQRNLYANIFRLLTFLSLQLNCSENIFAKLTTKRFPNFSRKVIKAISSFPVLGMAATKNTNLIVIGRKNETSIC